MPKRAYGTSVNGAVMSMTLKYLINSKDRQLAAYLNIDDGTFRKMEEAEKEAYKFGCEGAHQMGDKWMPCSMHKHNH